MSLTREEASETRSTDDMIYLRPFLRSLHTAVASSAGLGSPPVSCCCAVVLACLLQEFEMKIPNCARQRDKVQRLTSALLGMRISCASYPITFSGYFLVECNYPEEAVGVSEDVWCELQVNLHHRYKRERSATQVN